MPIASINPTTGETLKEFSAFNQSEIETALSRAAQAFEKYRNTLFERRAQWLMGAAAILEQEKGKACAHYHS